MLEQVRFSFKLKLLSFAHVGDGGARTIGDSGEAGERNPEFATIQRDDENRPVIEATSLRGAIRAHLRQSGLHDLAAAVLGMEEISNASEESEGRLRLHAGFLENAKEIRALDLKLPHWNCDRTPLAFILPGNRVDRDTGAVEDKHLYFVEMLPDGCVFAFTGTFLGSETEFEGLVGPVFAALANTDGFELGAQTAYGAGIARLEPDSVTYETRMYDVSARDYVVKDVKLLQVSPSVSTQCMFEVPIACKGPYFILDPLRAIDEDEDMVALMRDDETPVFTGKQFVQDLRRRSAWLERLESIEEQGGDYRKQVVDNVDRHLRAEDDPADLTRTERLFGVAGWGKRVRVRHVAVVWEPKRRFAGQAIKLDVFTQGPMDTALVEYDVPADIAVKISVVLDENGLLPGDKAHFQRVLSDLTGGVRGMRYGHATGAGFGAFSLQGEGAV